MTFNDPLARILKHRCDLCPARFEQPHQLRNHFLFNHQKNLSSFGFASERLSVPQNRKIEEDDEQIPLFEDEEDESIFERIEPAGVRFFTGGNK